MALQNTDLLQVQRAGVQYKMTAQQIADFVGNAGKINVATIAERDALTVATDDLETGTEIFVADASNDPTVDSGWAKYRVDTISPISFIKLQEQENLDTVIIAESNLAYVESTTGGDVTNSNGTGFTIPIVDLTKAGLATPDMFSKIHVPATAGLTPATNSINVDAGTQVITQNFDQLDLLP